ncbi:hypothetical protein AMTR_s00168p00056690 [Amborella trichopoda]|uniref:Uncharacterized protein n=1 Tax=Amborella trichopoda TaxID=13333 RepID=W1PQW9_AMBTC|nr:hypothetical protein AMTR_s00168p00056690 [Amborella trichopoda]
MDLWALRHFTKVVRRYVPGFMGTPALHEGSSAIWFLDSWAVQHSMKAVRRYGSWIHRHSGRVPAAVQRYSLWLRSAQL